MCGTDVNICSKSSRPQGPIPNLGRVRRVLLSLSPTTYLNTLHVSRTKGCFLDESAAPTSKKPRLFVER